MLSRGDVVKIFVLTNDINAIVGRLARINDSLKGNLLNEIFGAFHFGSVTSKAPKDRRAKLEEERDKLRLMVEEKRAEIQSIIDTDRRQQEVLDEIEEILKNYPMVSGANYERPN